MKQSELTRRLLSYVTMVEGMRIGIDARPLSKQRTGIGNYVQGLVELLPEVAPQHDYFLYSNKEINSRFPEGRYRRRFDQQFSWCPGAFWLLARGGRLARRDAVDVYWATQAVLPTRMPAGILKIVTVYDLVWLRCPETSTSYNLLVQRMCARKAIADADYIVVISRTTQDELIERLGVPREKTRLVYPGVADSYKPQDQAKAAEYISRKYSVPPRYMATVGIVHPRKNQQFLVKVLGILKNNGQLNCPLLVVGPIGWKNSPLFQEIQTAGLTESDIRFLGYIPDEDMPFFYGGAQVFLFPTLYEGFGLPPVEAMACGCPVIASDSPCMPEVLADAAILEPLENIERFTTSVLRVLADGRLREALRAKGILRAQKFRYATSVKQLLEVFEGAGRTNVGITRLESARDFQCNMKW
jgi:glycosyltransferase involved in cell wall biosynthesis